MASSRCCTWVSVTWHSPASRLILGTSLSTNPSLWHQLHSFIQWSNNLSLPIAEISSSRSSVISHFQIHKCHYYLLVLLYYFSFKELVRATSSKPLWASRTLLSVKWLVLLPGILPCIDLASQKAYAPVFLIPHLFSSFMFQNLYTAFLEFDHYVSNAKLVDKSWPPWSSEPLSAQPIDTLCQLLIHPKDPVSKLDR